MLRAAVPPVGRIKRTGGYTWPQSQQKNPSANFNIFAMRPNAWPPTGYGYGFKWLWFGSWFGMIMIAATELANNPIQGGSMYVLKWVPST